MLRFEIMIKNTPDEIGDNPKFYRDLRFRNIWDAEVWMLENHPYEYPRCVICDLNHKLYVEVRFDDIKDLFPTDYSFDQIIAARIMMCKEAIRKDIEHETYDDSAPVTDESVESIEDFINRMNHLAEQIFNKEEEEEEEEEEG